MRKTFSNKFVYATAIILAGNSAWAQRNSNRNSTESSPRTLAQAEELETFKVEIVGNIAGALGTQGLSLSNDSYLSPQLNLSSSGSGSLSGAVTRDGIPGRHGEGVGLEIDDLVARAYTSVQLIETILEERDQFALGQRILFLENGIRSVLARSGNRAEEETLRETLNRGLDVMSLVLPITANNPQLSAQWANNFYRNLLNLAAGLHNNNRQKILRRNRPENSEGPTLDHTVELLTSMSSAKYGQAVANLLWRHSTAPGTRAQKAVMLMRLVGYLGHDLNEDPGRREPGIARLVTDIYRMQKSSDPNNPTVYETILQNLRRGYGPSSSQLATLRSQVGRILIKMPELLGKSPADSLKTSP